MANKKCVLITGGTSGVGLELARLFAKDSYNLIIVARDMNELSTTKQQLQSEFGCEVTTVAKDLFNPDNAFALYDEINAKGMQVDVLVNDAGQGQYGEFKDTDIRRELDIINLNICSLVVLTKLYLKEMVSRGDGKILNLSSIASKTPGPWQSVYHATKAFVQSFTEAVRSEVKDKGVTLTVLLPGATDTDFFNKAEMQDSKIVAGGKLGDAAEVAKKGYDALMNGDDMVVTGFKNKMMVGMSNLMTDEAAADQMKKQQEPVNKK
jgi:hypothetical protein